MTALPTLPAMSSTPTTYYPQTTARLTPRQVPMSAPSGGQVATANLNPENAAGSAMTAYQANAGNDIANRLTPEMAQSFAPTQGVKPLTMELSPQQYARFHSANPNSDLLPLHPNGFGTTVIKDGDQNVAGRAKANFNDQFNTSLRAGTADDFAARVLPGQKPPTPQAGFNAKQGEYQDDVAARAARLTPGAYQERKAYSNALEYPPEDPRVKVANINAQSRGEVANTNAQGRQGVANTNAAAGQAKAATSGVAGVIGRGITAAGNVVSSLLKPSKASGNTAAQKPDPDIEAQRRQYTTMIGHPPKGMDRQAWEAHVNELAPQLFPKFRPAPPSMNSGFYQNRDTPQAGGQGGPPATPAAAPGGAGSGGGAMPQGTQGATSTTPTQQVQQAPSPAQPPRASQLPPQEQQRVASQLSREQIHTLIATTAQQMGLPPTDKRVTDAAAEAAPAYLHHIQQQGIDANNKTLADEDVKRRKLNEQDQRNGDSARAMMTMP